MMVVMISGDYDFHGDCSIGCSQEFFFIVGVR